MRRSIYMRGMLALITSLFAFGCLLTAAPRPARADDGKGKEGKKGPQIPIKVGDPIIIKDKDKKPPPKKK